VLTAFNAGAAGSQNIQTLIILRFFAGAFGSSPLTNAGGVIADMFPATQRGMAMSVFAAAPFLGPVLGKRWIKGWRRSMADSSVIRSDHWWVFG
jgi:MFS family permease